jgi:hypothetical protein
MRMLFVHDNTRSYSVSRQPSRTWLIYADYELKCEVGCCIYCTDTLPLFLCSTAVKGRGVEKSHMGWGAKEGSGLALGVRELSLTRTDGSNSLKILGKNFLATFGTRP